MMSFEDLPPELLAKIVNIVFSFRSSRSDGYDDLCNLRLASRRLEAIVSPVLFSTLRLRFDDGHYFGHNDFLRCRGIISALAANSAQVLQEYTRRLHFVIQTLYLDDAEGVEGVSTMRTVVEEQLFKAVSSLTNLHFADFYYNTFTDPETVAVSFIRALGTIKTLKEFKFQFAHDTIPQTFSLQPLSNLQSISISWYHQNPGPLIPEIAKLLARCPQLEEIRLGPSRLLHDSDWETAKMKEAFSEISKLEKPLSLRKLTMQGIEVSTNDIRTHLRHFQRLEFLGIRRDPSLPASIFGEICAILKDSRIFLRGVSTDITHHPLLLDYLTSYSGLQKLTFEPMHPLDDSPEALDQFFLSIIPKHSQTLRSLTVGRDTPNLWSEASKTEYCQAVVSCQTLRRLKVHVSVRTEDIEERKLSAELITRWLETASKLPRLVHLRLNPTNFFNEDDDSYMMFQRYRDARAFLNCMVSEFRQAHSPHFRINGE